jgi:hypothetical protein
LSEIEAEYDNVLYLKEVQWLSLRTVLKRLLCLRLEIKYSQMRKLVAELSVEEWLNMALLYYISHHLNDLNINLQGQQKLIYYMFGTAIAFEMKLRLFWKQVENVNLCHFPSCDLLHKDGPFHVFVL